MYTNQLLYPNTNINEKGKATTK